MKFIFYRKVFSNLRLLIPVNYSFFRLKRAVFVTLILSCVFINSTKSQSNLPENSAIRLMLESPALKSAHVGIYVYDDSTKKEIADFQGDKYFVPASNTKLFSLYAGMKYLGDSIEAARYLENDTALLIWPTGDPSLLHPDFQTQPLIDFLKKPHKKIFLVDGTWEDKPLGPGWAWDDYNDDYSVERSQFPLYGNFIRWTQQKLASRSNASFESTASVFSSPEISWKVRFSPDSLPKTFLVQRATDSNFFSIRLGNETNSTQDVPFITNNLQAAVELLPDTIGKPIYKTSMTSVQSMLMNMNQSGLVPMIVNRPISSTKGNAIAYPQVQSLYSRPADSIFTPMMYRSDNFFAEQTLLMVSNKQLARFNTELIIDTILSRDLADLPQKPNWVDGSGLSRYNLFSPRDFVSLLIKFKNEFGMERMKRILPTGGTGTLKNHYKQDSGYVYVKTGSMTGVLCLSGYIYTTHKHLLEFSILVNNHNTPNGGVRREMETYVDYLRKNF